MEKIRYAGLIGMMGGIIITGASIRNLICNYKQKKVIKATAQYKQLVDIKSQIYRIEHMTLPKLLSQDPNLPRTIPDFMDYYDNLTSKNTEIENSSNYLAWKKTMEDLKRNSGLSIGGTILGGSVIYFGAVVLAVARKKTRPYSL